MLSEEILIDRAGNFTASENHRLMAGWDTQVPSRDFEEFNELYGFIKPLYQDGERSFLVGDLKDQLDIDVTTKLVARTVKIIKSELPPTGLVTYAQEKAIEPSFDVDPSLNFETVHTRNGNEREEIAANLFAEETGLNVSNIGEDQIHLQQDGVGVTPDGLIYDSLDMIRSGLEIKCKSALEHAKNLQVNNNDDMVRLCFDHFTQVQTGMYVTGTNHWYFVNYNPFAVGLPDFKIVVIHRDNSFIRILKSRVEMAKRVQTEFYKSLKAA